jgi:CheY-like chemotaxis protein
MGIEPNIKDRIFDPYFTTKDIGEGLGMGLAIVYGLVKKHDGVLTVTSKVGKGTIAEVLFPIIKGEMGDKIEQKRTLPTGTERILFVDDEPSLVKLVNQMLTRLGYDVVARISSLDALELFKAEPDRFDLVITDMAMPHMAGDRFAHELLKIRPDISIILCTGYSERVDEVRSKELGIKAYVMKPLVMSVIAQTIRKVLDEAKAATQN